MPTPRRLPRRRRAAPPAIALLAALLLSACSSHTVQLPWVNYAVRLPGGTATPGAPPPQGQATATPQPQPTAPGMSIQQFVPLAKRFVEQHRGLTFKTDVPVTLLDDAAFRARLLDKGNTTKSDQAALLTTSKELKALHLMDAGVDLGAATDSLLGAGVSGFYDPKSKALVVRGVSATPYVRQVLVHELTHAVQDQWFGIDRPDLNAANDERFSAFQAVFEGDAVRIEDQYHAAMTPAEQSQANSESAGQGGGIPSGVPQVLLELISFPYVVGPQFVRTLQTLGGQARVDDAFVHPPTTTAQLIDINRFLTGDKPLTVAQPKADGTSFDHSVLGALGLLLLFEKVPSMSSADAVRAANLWGGDEYVAWDQPGGACLRDRVVASAPANQAALDRALAAYAGAAPGTSFVPSGSGGPGQLTACG
jgi:hypothetical protein